ncbi:hypothetical protein [Arthrobacter cryoconiti]|uniref:Minor tail protein n=1 Tax=Arthrobacter cryoconiti TaxID=748907 RepID=A0ABV8QXD2_9MICC|nr:hypothetical protein [Arthrobacter cryoconiti]MCC9068788.1 hypothetical protein [Arthrobacter cryoconiti]
MSTINRGPGVALVGIIGTTPKEHRLAIAGQYAENAPGVPRSGLLVTGAVNVVTPKAGMGYDIIPVQSVINRTVGEGVYTPTTTGSTSVATDNAPGAGSRWDLLWVKQNDAAKGDTVPAVGGVADNTAIFGVTVGSAAASPTKPIGDVPAGALVIAEAQIFAGTTGTNQAPSTITQVFPITAARGAPLPVRSVADRATITAPAIGQQVLRLDLAGIPVQIWTGTKWGGPPRGQLAQALSTFDTSFGTALNFIAEAILTVEPNRWIQITAQSEGQSNTDGLVAAYFLKAGGASGSTFGDQINVTNKSYAKAGLGDGLIGFSGRYNTGAGGSVRFSLQAKTVITAGIVSAVTGATTLVVDDVGPA